MCKVIYRGVAVVLFSVLFAQAATAKVDFYVSPSGDDSALGNLERPFATLTKARDAIRELKEAGGLSKGIITVHIRAGVYPLTESFTLTDADSGTESLPIVYRAYKDEEVRLIGGKQIDGFKPITDPAVLKRIDKKYRDKILQTDLRAQGITDFSKVSPKRFGGPAHSTGLELFFEDEPMTLARWPNEGFVKIAGLVEPGTVNVRGTKGSKTGKFIYDGDRPKRWAEENDVWVHGYWFWDWSDERQQVESIDTDKRIISVAPPYHGYGYRVGQWFYGLNILAELDGPGEWYLDREMGILYFWPPEPIEKGRAVVSVLNNLVEMSGVSHVAIQGVIFEAARGTAVVMSNCEDMQISGSILRNLGGSAVQIAGGSGNNVMHCEIYGTGSGGISLSGGDRKALRPGGHSAFNNHIHHYGRWQRMYTPAIGLGGVGNKIVHNLIHTAPHMAVMFSGNDHVIELNEIHNVCLESNDAGAIYAGRDWTMRGTVIRHNYLHEITGFENRGCVGVYLDDMFCGTEIYGNVFYKVTRAAFIGGGRDCLVENNIFVDCKPALHIDARAMTWAGYHVGTTMTDRLKDMPYTSELWRKRYPKLVNILEDEPAAPKGNIVRRNICSGGKWLELHGVDKNIVTWEDNLIDKEPGFVNASSMNFQLKDDSGAYKLGFKPIPIEKIGLLEDFPRE
ncbi:MAG: right-handed parallel beta-helix repeat-containing protein [Planctomycetes bacterium]|nr:right-handed parallel beta-helix repeat-containing protein [Planctomycetota bacterium]MBL7144984.1 right-handed parallel beta-helix repeat-containing protein [Phycisphaerae bacterium]